MSEYKFKTFWMIFIITIITMILFGVFVPFPYIVGIMFFPIPMTLLIMRISRLPKQDSVM